MAFSHWTPFLQYIMRGNSSGEINYLGTKKTGSLVLASRFIFTNFCNYPGFSGTSTINQNEMFG
jgi:hypothetical protein